MSDARPPIETLKKRADFLAAARARRWAADAFVLQARRRAEGEKPDASAVRIGFTCSKKVGHAPARNRAKRRLREAARAALPAQGRPGWDYVLIGRAGTTAAISFDRLVADLGTALARVHADRAPSASKLMQDASPSPDAPPGPAA